MNTLSTPNHLSKPSDIPGVVVDSRTGLMWSEETIGGSVNQADALAAASAVQIGGFTDWRLPTIDELLSIVDYTRSSPAINTDFFECQSDWYWTSSAWAPAPAGNAWFVNFLDGRSNGVHRDGEARVRAVRSVSGGGQ